ncbi:MAG: aminotransferase class III-fold pyridoxal phosphate-dependent enzyme [Oligoflexia bacterium]|nr:aminotransferase class III-fold pyridoxal phosphate-dependent enzyme [Oligoflexia bacterium]
MNKSANKSVKKLVLERSEQLYKEAWDLFPGAVAGIRRPYNFVPGEYPIFFEHASGGRVTDVDGNEYIDMLCAYGPIIIGHREREIDEAVVAHIRDKGFCMSLTQETQIKLGNKLRQLIPCCEKLVFVKTGSDATSVAIRIARAYTQKIKILRCGYHGWHDWCVEVKGGIPAKLYEDIFEFHYNDLEGVKTLLQQHRGEVAAIMVTPVGHPLAEAVQMPAAGFLEGLRSLAYEHQAVLIYDEVRSGFRVNLGGAQQEFGVIPDIAVFGKAMANGYPISAVVGNREIMDVLVDKVFLSSTFFPNSLEMVAALKNIELLEREKVLDKIKERGNRFAAQVQKIVANSEMDCTLSGAPWMPFITFNRDEKKLYKDLRTQFYTQLIRRGVFLQPYHHGYIAYRHSVEDLDFVASAIEESLTETKKKILD